MNRPVSFIVLVCQILSLVACTNNPNTENDKQSGTKQIQEQLVEANKEAVKIEKDQIDALIARQGWQMNETGTGLRYIIYENGSGEKAKTGKIARLNYEVKLITGDLVYSSKVDGIKEFRIGSGGVESGLEEGILLLRVGDKAKFIIPSYLAYGLAGDQSKIPPKATLIYDLELIELQ